MPEEKEWMGKARFTMWDPGEQRPSGGMPIYTDFIDHIPSFQDVALSIYKVIIYLINCGDSISNLWYYSQNTM